MTEIEKYCAPSSVEEAVKILAGGPVTVLAGGTDLTPQTENGRIAFAPALMNIRRIEEMSGVTLADGRIRIGALTTVAEILADATIAEHAPVLAEAADHFASAQIRNAATLGGNLCNASPAGDMIIPLLVLDAEVELTAWDGGVKRRQVPLADFFTGPGKTVKQAGELLTAVIFALPPQGYVARFRKSGPRPALEISTVSLGIGGVLKDGALTGVRVAMGAVAPTPLRARGVEAALDGAPLNDETITRAVEAATAAATPIDDVRASAWYRTHLVRIFTEELLRDVADN